MTDVGDFEKIAKEDFRKLQLLVGTIAQVKQHPEVASDYVLEIDMLAADEATQVVASLKDGYRMEELIGKQCIVCLNIVPEQVVGVESAGVLLVTHNQGKPVLVSPDKNVPQGAQVTGMMNGELIHES